MKAVIYARYSSDNQREESIEGQFRECKEYAKKMELRFYELILTERSLQKRTTVRNFRK